ncbi:MAG: amidohydrolase family protein [Myxococcota bacterium]
MIPPRPLVCATLLLACHRDPPPPIPRIDIHVHAGPASVARLVALMDTRGIAHAVNLSGMIPGGGLEVQLAAAAAAPGRVSVFANLDWRFADPSTFAAAQVALLGRARALGARGLKIPKALGLGYAWSDGRLIAIDDPALDPIFDEAGRLGLPVAIHSGDPKAFWQAPTPDNERYDELRAHPAWSFYGQPVPSWQELFDAFARRVARHPRTTFIGVHFGNAPEDPDAVARLLARCENLVIDTAARVPEIGRHDAAKMRRFFEKWQDRVLFGTDLGVGREPGELMLGSTGEAPPTTADVDRFFAATWRYFETRERGFAHPTPIQGRWTIDGVGLPRAVLEKIYRRNAERVLGIALTPTR